MARRCGREQGPYCRKPAPAVGNGRRGGVLESGRFHCRGAGSAPLNVRNLLILILVFIAIWWLRAALRRFKDQGGFAARRAARKERAAPERMLECAHCGVNVPESEGVSDERAFYCCDAHRRAGPRAH